MNFHPVKQLFQIASTGDQTADPWVTSQMLSPYTTGTSWYSMLLGKYVLTPLATDSVL